LEKLKKICQNLSLEPTGFVVLPEAVAHIVKSEEGTPLSAVVVGAGEENLEVTIFRLGKLIGSSVVARSVSIIEDIEEGLARFFSDEAYPSRIILYDGKEGELEDIKQSLLKVSWEDLEKIKFLHTPKIEVFNPERKVIAVSLAGASEVAGVSSLKKDDDDFIKADEAQLDIDKETEQEKDDVDNLGFMVGEDIAEAQQSKQKILESSPTTLQKDEPMVKTHQRKESIFFSKIQKSLDSFASKISNIGLPKILKGKKRITFGAIGLGTFLILGLAGWWFIPKATVTVYVAPRKLTQEFNLKVNPNASGVDFSNKLLPGKVVSASESGEKTTSTSGVKTIGEKASGSVEIRNGTSSKINLSAGTIIASSNDLEFTLDNSASVSAALSPSNPGTTTIGVTAINIGAEYNLAKDETFSVANYTKVDVDAIAISDFSGGSSREISAVGEGDQKNLLEELTNELLDIAKGSLTLGISDEEYFIEESVVATASARKFSDKVGDEASTLKLNLSIDADGIIVKKANLLDLARDILKDEIPEGYILRENQISIDFKLEGEEKGVYDFIAKMEANLLPEIKVDEVAQKIAGKYPPLAQDYLNTIPGYSRAEISLSPQFPGRLGTLPHIVKRISVEVAAER